jgi:hypothetical protein
MKLSPPLCVGPVSACNKIIRVQQQLTGATVQILLNHDKNNPIAKFVATWPDQVVPLTNLPAGGLKKDDLITAIQSLGPDTSDETPQTLCVQVQKFDPAGLKEIIFQSHLYVCGRYLILGGMIPGCTVVAGPGGTRGNAETPDGTARLVIDPGLAPNEHLSVVQIACGGTGPAVLGPAPDPTPTVSNTLKLPAPQIASPPYECDRAVLMSGMIEGAEISLFIDGGPPITGGTFFKTAWFDFGSPPLKTTMKLQVNQDMQKCRELQPSDKSVPPTGVLPAAGVAAPGVASPLCAGMETVLVYGVSPGSRVRVLQDGAEIAVAESAGSTCTVVVPGLRAKTGITAQQQRCNTWSAQSAPSIPVDPAPADIGKLAIAVNPLNACSDVVPVTNIHPGSWVRILSDKLGHISGPVFINTTEASIPIAPVLQAGDRIQAFERGCAGIGVFSDKVPVVATPALGQPQIVKPVESGQSSIVVKNVVSGAKLEIYLNGAFVTATDSGLPSQTVNLGVLLQVGDHLNARQILCNSATTINRENDVVVVKPRPKAPINLTPSGGTTGQTPSLSWADPDRGKIDAADTFNVVTTVNGVTTSHPAIGAATPSFTFPSALPFSATVSWSVSGTNSTATGPTSSATFHIQDKPAPPPPKGPSKIVLHNCTADRDVLNIWLYDATTNTTSELGSIEDEYDDGDSCPAQGSDGFEVSLTDGHSYLLVAVDVNLIGCGVDDPTVPACQKWSHSFIADKNGPTQTFIIAP